MNTIFKNGSEDGISLMELAISLPFLLILIAGILQFGYLLAAHVIVRQATVTSAREALLGLPARTDGQIRAVADSAVEPMLSSDNIRQLNITRNVNVGGVGGATRVELIYDLAPFVPGMFSGNGPNGEFVVRSVQVVR